VASIPALLVLTVIARRDVRRRVTRWFARAFFLSIGTPVKTANNTSLPTGPCVVVANHSSYLDGMILTAALPPRFTFIIKHEMSTFPFAGYLLRRIGSEFVKREDGRQKNHVTRRLYKAAGAGDALAFFPEGTFDKLPGLRRFHPGAFAAAWHAKLPIVPVVIFGARAKLPANAWLPAPGALSVAIGKPIHPSDHSSARDLLNAARAVIHEQLGEPDRHYIPE